MSRGPVAEKEFMSLKAGALSGAGDTLAGAGERTNGLLRLLMQRPYAPAGCHERLLAGLGAKG
jgi:hypothetical protein